MQREQIGCNAICCILHGAAKSASNDSADDQGGEVLGQGLGNEENDEQYVRSLHQVRGA